MYPHRIRLRGPWETGAGPEHVIIPAKWGQLPLDAPEVKFTRRFGLPRTLDDYERVWLTVTGLHVPAKLRINSLTMPDVSNSDLELDITTCLQPRNVLQVTMQPGSPDSVPWQEIALEIRGPYFLRNVVVENGTLAGLVVGPADAPLELYILRSGSTLRYERVTATPEGMPFCFDVNDVPADSSATPRMGPWKVELVEAANRWFSVEIPGDGV